MVESDSSSCGLDFAPGVSYLVQARRSDDGHSRQMRARIGHQQVRHPRRSLFPRELQRGVSNPRVFGSLVEFLKPGPSSRSTDSDLERPVANVKVVAISENGTREPDPDSQGRFSIAAPAGTYTVALILPSGLTSEKPYQVEVSSRSVMVTFSAMSWNPANEPFFGNDGILERKNCDVEPTMRSLTSENPTEVRFCEQPRWTHSAGTGSTSGAPPAVFNTRIGPVAHAAHLCHPSLGSDG